MKSLIYEILLVLWWDSILVYNALKNKDCVKILMNWSNKNITRKS